MESLGYPVPTHATEVRDALCGLCGSRVIGIRHERDSACGRRPSLADGEWPEAVIAEPFEDAGATPMLPGGGQGRRSLPRVPNHRPLPVRGLETDCRQPPILSLNS
jgi:hypothetical protein